MYNMAHAMSHTMPSHKQSQGSPLITLARTTHNSKNTVSSPAGSRPLFRIFGLLGLLLVLSACTEEARNQLSRTTDNFLGEDLLVSYIDGGVVVKSWTVKDGKITSGKDSSGNASGYYYFWSVETGYVQVPIERTIIEEIRKTR